MVNHNKICRLYREERLMVRKRARKRLVRSEGACQPDRSIDIVSGQLVDGGRFRTINVVDDYSGRSRKCSCDQRSTA